METHFQCSMAELIIDSTYVLFSLWYLLKESNEVQMVHGY